MGNLGGATQGDAALASVDNSTGTPAYNFNRGFAAAITDNGVGDLTLTLSQEQNLTTQGLVNVTISSATPFLVSATPVGATGVRIRTWSATVASPAVTAAADASFWCRVTPVTSA